MNLQPIPGRSFSFSCYGCGKTASSRGEVSRPYEDSGPRADLDGPPFRAYYCAPCAAALNAEAQRAEALREEGSPS